MITKNNETIEITMIDDELFELNKEPKKILIVEDDFINVLILKKLLAPLNFILETAENGQIGLDLFKENKYDLILMDIYMPIMDGLEASRRIRAISLTPPIIVISAAALNEETLRKEIGIDYFLPKPYNVFTLKKLIKKILIIDENND